jgi:hypothetical protein
MIGAVSGRPAAGWVAGLLLVAIAITARPWGDYPTNDDWQYARIAKRFAETGTLAIDVPIAPSLVGQVVAVAPLIRVFGFSHTMLRITTMLLAVGLLLVMDRLLSTAALGWKSRVVALVALGANPLFANLSLSFMTEIWGFVPALLGAWIWLRRRPRPGVPWDALAAGVLCGLSFWIRQYAVLVLPALWTGAWFATAGEARRRLRMLATPVLASLGGAASFVAGYFLWAQRSGALRPEFTEPLAKLVRLDATAWAAESGPFVLFLGLSCLPMFVFALVERRRIMRRQLAAGLVIGVLGFASARLFASMVRASPQHAFFMGHHASFPFVGNILSESGVGAVTLSDVYWLGAPEKPRWLGWLWGVVVAAAIGSGALWGLLLEGRGRAARPERDAGRELFGFGAALLLLSFAVAVQAYGVLVFDRYYFPALLGATLAVSARLLPRGDEAGGGRGLFAAAAVVFAFAVFTTAGVHNYFRWNDARWALYHDALGRGADPRTVDGGYEAQGWHALDLLALPMDPGRCRGECSCRYGWYCADNSYQVVMNRLPGYGVLREVSPAYWLAEGPPLLLLERSLRPADATGSRQ